MTTLPDPLGRDLPIGAKHYRAYVGPPDKYDLIAATQFNLLTTLGLREEHFLLDIGCGSLRGGRLFIPYLLPGRYFGLEPERWLVETGLQQELGQDIVTLKQPMFRYEDDFTLTAFNQTFDFLLAQSIFSHASLKQIERCLSQAQSVMRVASIFVATFFEGHDSYSGETWAYPESVTYRFGDLADVAANCGLTISRLMWPHPNQQIWVAFRPRTPGRYSFSATPQALEYVNLQTTTKIEAPVPLAIELHPAVSASRPVIITGMHRSGTSLVARLLQSVGLKIGDQLLGPDKGNRHGHFEDVDFYNFHEALLRRLGQGFLIQTPGVLGQVTPAEFSQAAQLIESRAGYPLWGWKDPRTALFLSLWQSLAPRARYIFVYRHPVEVILSLLRRATDMDVLVEPLTGLRAWQTYNQLMLDFYRERPAECVLGNVARITSDLQGFLELVVTKLEVPLQRPAFSPVYQADDLKQFVLPAAVQAALEVNMPEALKLYAQLESQADLPGQAPSASLPAYSWSDQTQPDPSHISRALSLELTRLDPEAMLAGKHALDMLRLEQIRHLEHAMADREATIRLLTTHTHDLEQLRQTNASSLQGLTARLEAVNRLLAGREAQITSLNQLVANQDARIQNQVARLEELAKLSSNQVEHIQTLTTHLRTLEQARTDQQAQVQSLIAQAAHLEQKLATIEHSRIWRLAMRWYAWRDAILLRGRQPVAPQLQLVKNITQVAETNPPPQASRSTPRSSAPRTILFVSHDAHRHGAQLLLLNFLKWFKANTSTPFEILLGRDGELRSEFEQLAPVTIWAAGPDQAQLRQQILERFRQANIGLLYANTIVNGDILESLSGLNCPVICHVHELGYWITHQTRPGNNAQIRRWTTRYIAVSQSVQQALIQTLQIPESQIDLVYEFIPTTLEADPSPQKLQQIRQQLHIPPEAMIVGGSGTTDWRKGPDLFVQLARAVHRRRPERPIHFVWVGGESQGPRFGALWHDVQRIGLEAHIHFVGARPNPLDYFAIFDVFALVSREDPFPLVALEAASLGKPVVCFNGSGGAPELVEADSGYVVPYLDVEAMADKVGALVNSPELRERFGQRANQKVRERYTTDIVAPMLASIIERAMQ